MQEKGLKVEVIAVPPVYYDICDSYNTRMRPDQPCGRPNKERAFLQWSRLISKAANELFINVRIVEPQQKLFDMAFACDPGLWVDDIFIRSNFWAKPRQPEVDHFTRWFRANNYTLGYLGKSALFEGGDCVFVKNKIIIGFGQNRTNKQGVSEVKEILSGRNIDVVPIRRVTEEFYHLNSVLTYYPTADLIMYYPAAFEKSAGEKLAVNFPGTIIIPLQKETLYRKHPDFAGEYLYSYALNAIERHGIAIQPYCDPIHKKLLNRHGISVVVPEDGSSEFERSGGSYRCLLMIHNETK